MTTRYAATSRFRLTLLLWAFGMLGMLAIVITVLPERLPELLDGRQPPAPLWLISSAAVVQAAAVLMLAAWLGSVTGRSVGLHAPAFEAAARGEAGTPALAPQLIPGLAYGLAAGLFLYGLNSFGPEAWVSVQSRYYPALATRLLYGGITEEVLLRWGLMSSLVWLLGRAFRQRTGTPHPACVWLGIVISALLFGLGHLPAVASATDALDADLVVFIVGGNAAAGVLFGWLYWRYGLEAAIVAHGGAHLVNYVLGIT